MIDLRLGEIATIVDGTLSDPAAADVLVTAPAVIDSRAAEPGGLFVAFAGEHVDGHEYAAAAGAAGAVAAIGTRATALPTVVVADPQVALQRLAAEVLARLRAGGRITVIAMTGSQGKTSTKDMLAAILTTAADGPGETVATVGSLNNELGVPLTVLRATPDTRFLVLEMGARGIGHVAELAAIAPPDVAIVLNVGTAHLGEFGSQDAIATAKGELVEGLRADGTAVLNADDPRVSAMAARLPDGAERVITFGVGSGADVRLEGVELDGLGRPRFTLATPTGATEVVLPIVGTHQAHNAAAAVAAAQIVGIEPDRAAAALAGARLSKWRMELTELPTGTTLLNDAYNANPESMRAAIDALTTIEPGHGGRRIAVLGEMRELGEGSAAAHFEMGVHAAARGVDLVLVVGFAAAQIEMGARTIDTVFVEDNPEAITWLREHLTPADVVLLKASRGARLDEVADALP